MKSILQKLPTFGYLIIATYSFLSVCNWDFNPNNWNGFSHFLSACVVFVAFFGLED